MASRRQFLQASASLLGAVAAADAASGSAAPGAAADFAIPPTDKPPQQLAADEAHWQAVGRLYPQQEAIINLEHGYWGQMATPVEEAFVENTRRVNRELAWYARRHYGGDFIAAIDAVAGALGAARSEIMLTRNASEAFVNLITQYRSLERGDGILWADADYPSFQRMLRWLATERGAEGRRLSLPPRAAAPELLRLYTDAIADMPRLKLLLLTHVSNQHGLVLPVREIAAFARERGIDVICDCAQSWGLLDFRLDDLAVDWAVFNLHKWIGSPVGVGALYMRDGTREPVAPFPGEAPGDEHVRNRVHLATSDFAAFLTVPTALAFHRAIGGANKEARLRHLRRQWVAALRDVPQVELLGAADEGSSTGMGSLRLRGESSEAAVSTLQQTLEREHGIFTVLRKGLASGCCIRVTPQVYTPSRHLHALAEAIGRIARG